MIIIIEGLPLLLSCRQTIKFKHKGVRGGGLENCSGATAKNLSYKMSLNIDNKKAVVWRDLDGVRSLSPKHQREQSRSTPVGGRDSISWTMAVGLSSFPGGPGYRACSRGMMGTMHSLLCSHLTTGSVATVCVTV